MKQILLFLGLFLQLTNSYSQANLWWKLDGDNAATSATALGTSNNEPLRFNANGTEWFRISPAGTYTLFSLTDPSFNGLLVVRANGDLARVNYTGNANDVFRGDGTFGSISTLTGWTLGTNLTTGYNVGIGTVLTPEKLTVDGNILATGSISGTSLNVVDIVTTGREFKISTSICMKGIDANDPLSRNELCGMNGDLFIQSETNNSYNTIFHLGNFGKVGIGRIPTEGFHVGVDARFDGKVHMNRIMPIDSVFSIGDSTLNFSGYFNNIWGSSNGTIKGTGFGSPNTFGTGLRAVAIGNKVKASADFSIVIGSTDASSIQLNNTIPYSLMIGFNSDLPTMTVLPATGNGTFGQVGIGTTCIPADYLLAVKGKIIMEEGTVKLADANGCWPDFVFEESYQRMSWQTKSEFLSLNKHLPYMPSANSIENNGFDLGTGIAAITQNVEENTLEIIDLYKELELLKAEMEKLRLENEKLKNNTVRN